MENNITRSSQCKYQKVLEQDGKEKTMLWDKIQQGGRENLLDSRHLLDTKDWRRADDFQVLS